MKSKYFNRLYIIIGLVLAVLMIERFSGGVVYAAGKAKVSVSYSGNSVLKGNSLKLTAKLKNSSSCIKKTNYKSSNSSIAAVTSSGIVKGKKEGTATITVKVKTKAGKSYSKKIKITVKSSVTEKTSYITASDAVMLKGNSYKLQPVLKNSRSRIKSTNYKSSDTSVASVSSNGTIVGNKAGTAAVTIISVTEDNQTLAKTVTVYVNSSVSSNTPYISLTASTSIKEGKTTTIIPMLKNSSSSIKSISYKSSNTKAVEVSSDGEVSGKSYGSAVITATVITEDQQTLVKTINLNIEHNIITTETDATCVSAGKIIKRCTKCGETEVTETPAKGHDYGEWKVEAEATEESEGVKVKVCSSCGIRIAETIPKKIAETGHKHNYTVTDRVEATCTESGYIKETCDGCNDIKVTKIEALGHTEGEWSYSEGENVLKCSVCGEILETQTTANPTVPGYTIDLGNGKTTVVEGNFNRTMADEIYALLNAYRAEKGLKKLERDDTLAGSADIRGYETSYLFDHIRPNGMSIATLQGIKGENIAYGYKTAGAVIAAWKASSGHNANMLRDYYTKVGISVFVKKNVYASGAVYETYHLVQVFGY